MLNTAVAQRVSKYFDEVRRYPVLTRDEELALAWKWRNEGDENAARSLVTSNLRFVVKIAREYQRYGMKLEDLIQEGNVGLLHAVQKFDPEKGYRLISYAVWWIKAYIHNFILRSWSLVKMGTTQAQRRLFYQLGRAKRRLAGELEGASRMERERILAEKLDASTDEIREMEKRISGRDAPLDVPIGDDTDTTFLDLVPSREESTETVLEGRSEKNALRRAVATVIKTLSKRDRYILEHRILAEEPQCLREIGTRFDISRERVRQLESLIIERLREIVCADLGVEAKGKVRFDAGN